MKKNIIILIGIIIVVAFVLLFILQVRSNNFDKIIKNENAQVDVLLELFEETLSVVNPENVNLTLDESALNNFVTHESFTEENVSKLKQIEKSIENTQIIYKLGVDYAEDTNILTINISDNEGKYSHIQNYKLNVKDGKIIYETEGPGTTINK